MLGALLGAPECAGAIVCLTAGAGPDSAPAAGARATTAAAAPSAAAAAPLAFARGLVQREGGLLLAAALATASIALEYSPGSGDDGEPLVSGALTRGASAQLALALLCMIVYWVPIAHAALLAARHSRAANMDTLVSLSSGVAFSLASVISVAAWAGRPLPASLGPPPFAAAATLLALVAFARELETRARRAARRAVDELARVGLCGGRVAARAKCAARGAAACASCERGWGVASGAAADVSAATAATATVMVRVAEPAGPAPPAPLPSPARPAPPTVAASLLHLGDELLVQPDEVFAADAEVLGVAANSGDGEEGAEGFADEAMLTGEAQPVRKAAGDEVFGGTRNIGAALRVLVTRLPGAGALARVVSLIDEAQAVRPRAALMADAVAAAFTPFVVAASVATFAAWWAVAASGRVDTRGSDPAAFALGFALSLLVVSCPCAIALTVAPAALVATSALARAGVLLSGGGAALEAAAGCDVCVVDKTGTLTEGFASVVAAVVVSRSAAQDAALALGVRTTAGTKAAALAAATRAAGPAKATAACGAAVQSKAPALPSKAPPVSAPAAGGGATGLALSTDAALMLGAAAAVALNSPHPLAAAVRRAAARASAVVIPDSACRGEERHALPGRGVRAVAPDGVEVWLGAPEWIESTENGCAGASGAVAAAAPLRAAAQSVVALALEGELVGVFALEDRVRPRARETLARLRALGLGIIVASGDGAAAVARAAAACGVADSGGDNGAAGKEGAAGDDGTAGIGVGAGPVRSGLSPEGKVALVRALQRGGRRVLFVGDGVNDAAAIAAADAGVAVRGCSASSAQAAGALLQREDLGGVVALVRMARGARALVAANWCWAAAYNAVAMPLAAGAAWPTTGAVAIPLALAGASEAVSTLPVLASALLLWLVPLS